MEKKKRLYYALGGFVLGLLTASLIWLHIRPRTNTDIPAGSGGNHADNKKGDPGGLPQSTTNPNQDTAHNNSTANIPSKTPDNSQIDNPTNTPDINPDTTINPGQNVNPDNNQTDNPTNTPDINPDTTKNPGEDFNPDKSEEEPPKDSPGTVTEITSAPPEDTAQNETPVNPPTNSQDKNPETTDVPTRMPEITPPKILPHPKIRRKTPGLLIWAKRLIRTQNHLPQTPPKLLPPPLRHGIKPRSTRAATL